MKRIAEIFMGVVGVLFWGVVSFVCLIAHIMCRIVFVSLFAFIRYVGSMFLVINNGTYRWWCRETNVFEKEMYIILFYLYNPLKYVRDSAMCIPKRAKT